jgi:hypothetical protein
MNIIPHSYRIGNLLRESGTRQVVEVIGLKKLKPKPHSNKFINFEEFVVEVSGNFEDGWRLEEILLTPDIFFALGFKPGKDKFYNVSFFIGLFGFWSDSGSKDWYWSNCGTSLPIHYVSELQNVYFNYFKKDLDVSPLKPQPIP